MASDIVTATAEPETVRQPAAQPAEAPPAQAAPAAPRRRRRRRLSPLTRRVLTVNVLALALLGVGILYLGEYQQSLVTAELESLKTEGQIFAAALGEGAVIDVAGEGEALVPELGRDMMRRLVEPTRTRARLFDDQGALVADTRVLRGPGGTVQVQELPAPGSLGILDRFNDAVTRILKGTLPWHSSYRPYRELPVESAADYPEVGKALAGDIATAVREQRDTGGLLLTVAVPVQRYKEVLGAVLLSQGSSEIEEAVRAVRFEILKVFAFALGVTVLMSIYLAGTIAQPVRRLAAAAESVRRLPGRHVTIPDLSKRRDEIGDLSRALRDMTAALWQRMDAIERFAADVAHEIKNPLTSLKSAVETAARVEDPGKQRKLLALVQEDVERLDRLITDISDASRVDAELSRGETEPVAIDRLLETLVEVHRETAPEGAPELVLSLPESTGRSADLAVLGIDSRLFQVFRNLIANAVSFSPPGGTIRVAAARCDDRVEVTVEDEGPGLPAGKLEAIFERFYSERPAGEKFGTHSGLGLSISKQIIEAHRGTISAENRVGADGSILGARFIVRLPMA
jgi:two-component system, OmpR family, sensor histidine kinase ChvG